MTHPHYFAKYHVILGKVLYDTFFCTFLNLYNKKTRGANQHDQLPSYKLKGLYEIYMKIS